MKESASGKSKATKRGLQGGRNGTLATGQRPSRARRVEAVEGSCEVCGSTSWDSDDIRGETVCSECGYVASENMIDPGAEWVNHSNGDDRSRVGAPTTLTLSDKGLSTEIRRSDLTSGGAKRHGLSGKALRDWRRRQRIDQRSKTRKARTPNSRTSYDSNKARNIHNMVRLMHRLVETRTVMELRGTRCAC